MSFEVKRALQGAEAYRDFDVNNHDQKETPMVSFAEISEIITQWGETLFANDFSKAEGFGKIKNFTEDQSFEASDINERMKNAALFLHGSTWKSLTENKSPDEEQLANIQKIFQEVANSLVAPSDKITKDELTQIALHPRLLTRCSRVFVEDAAFGLDDLDDVDYSVDGVLNNNREMHEQDHEIADAVRTWSNYIPAELVTKEGLATIEAGVSYPYFNTMMYTRDERDSINETMKYLASVVAKAVKEDRELTDYEQKNLGTVFNELLKHLENIQASYALYNPKNEAAKELEDAKEALATYQKESAERKEDLTSKHQDAVERHAEAAAARKGSLEDVLAVEVTTREACVAAAKQLLDDTVEEDEKKVEELTTAVAEAQEKYNNLVKEAKSAPLYEDYVSDVSDATMNMVVKLGTHQELAVLCMKDFLNFAKARTDRELEKQSGWFGRIWG